MPISTSSALLQYRRRHIPLAQAHQTVVLAAGGSLLVLAGMLTFLANYLVNAFGSGARV
jgi:hypothetical protein